MSELGEALSRELDETAGSPAPGTLDAVVSRRDRRRARALGRVTAVSVVVALAAVAAAALSAARTARGPATSALGPPARVAGARATGGATPRGASRESPAARGATAPGGLAFVATHEEPAATGLAFSRRAAASLVGGCEGGRCGSGPLHLLLARDRGGVGVRAFTTGDAARAGVSRSLGSCRSGGSLVVEVSDSRAVGELVVVRRVPARGGSLPVDLVASAVVGAREGAPVLVVVVHSDAAVARVSATATGGGADATTPAGGWSVLTEPLPAGPASPVVPAEVVATATSGRALAAVRIPGEPAVALPAACRASGTGPSGTGPSGTGPSGTGPSGTGPPASLPGAGAGPG